MTLQPLGSLGWAELVDSSSLRWPQPNMFSHLPGQLEDGWPTMPLLGWPVSLFHMASFSSRPIGASWDTGFKKKKNCSISLNTQIWHTTILFHPTHAHKSLRPVEIQGEGEKSHLMTEELQSHIAKGRNTGKSEDCAHFGNLSESASPTCTLQPSAS